MVDESVIYALCAAGFAAANRLLFRKSAVADCNPWATLQIICVLALGFVWILFGPPKFAELSLGVIAMLMGVGVLWVIISLCDFRAYRFLEASHAAVLDSFSIVLVALFGMFLFGEQLAFLKVLGMGLLIAATVFHISPVRKRVSAGISLKLASLFLMTIALSIDKLLTQLTSNNTILFFGFLVPALLYSVLRPSSKRDLQHAITQSGGVILLIPLLSVARLYCTLTALSSGSLVLTYALLQMEIPLVQSYELFVSRDWSQLQRRMLASAACIIGVVLIRM